MVGVLERSNYIILNLMINREVLNFNRQGGPNLASSSQESHLCREGTGRDDVGMQIRCVTIFGTHALAWTMPSLGPQDQVGRIQRYLGGHYPEVNGL